MNWKNSSVLAFWLIPGSRSYWEKEAPALFRIHIGEMDDIMLN